MGVWSVMKLFILYNDFWQLSPIFIFFFYNLLHSFGITFSILKFEIVIILTTLKKKLTIFWEIILGKISLVLYSDRDVMWLNEAFPRSQMCRWKGWGLRLRIKWRSRQNGFPRISNKFNFPFEPIARVFGILIFFQKGPSGPSKDSHTFDFLDLSSPSVAVSKRLLENGKRFLLFALLVVTVGWSLFGRDSQICHSWYCSYPLFDFFQLFPINPFFLQIIPRFFFVSY